MADLISNMNCDAEQTKTSESDSLARMQRFCGALSHDLNNYVGAILGYAELMKLELNDKSELMCYLECLEQTCVKFRAQSSMLENFAENQRIVCSPCNVSALLLRASPTLASGSPVQWDLSPDMMAHADPSILEKIMSHILENAREAAEPGSPIVLRTSKRDHFVAIEVCDSGSGMTDDVAAQIFDPYFTTKGRGRGRGMTWVRGWVGRMGGKITIQPNFPCGTRVTVLLPPIPTEDESY